jgi:O-acetyl-ADP-ribose deacetylase (regulator of RNase III)
MFKTLIKSLRARFSSKRAAARVEFVLGDITTQEVDVIVNAAKPSLLGGGGVDGAIHRAGGPAILEECRAIAAQLPGRSLATGQAVITGSGDLPALMVVHTVGPIYPTRAEYPDVHGDLRAYVYQHRAQQLRDCYTSSINLAHQCGARSIAFPLISSGVYGWPVEDAIDQALAGIEVARPQMSLVRLVMFDKHTYRIALERVAKFFPN